MKTLTIKDTYEVSIDEESMSVEEFQKLAEDVVSVIQRKETKDAAEEVKLIHADGTEVKKGDEVTSFRGEKAIVSGWEVPAHQGKSGKVYVHWIREGKEDESELSYYVPVFNLSWKGLPWQKEETKDSASKGEKIAKVIAKFFKGSVGPMGGEDPEVEGNILTLYSQAGEEIYRFNDDGSIDFINIEEAVENWAEEEGLPEEEKQDFIDEYSHFDSLEDLILSGLSWFIELDLDEIEEEMKSIEDSEVKDIPLVSPEEKITISHSEKMQGKSSGITYSMIETAFKERNLDGGEKFKAFVEVAEESLKDDIANAKSIVSGEQKSTRKLLLEDYVKIEKLIEKAGMAEKLEEFKALVDELSSKLDLDYFKQPKFKKSEIKKGSQELRKQHRFDSRIKKEFEPIFLCSERELESSYKGALSGKPEEVARFRSNLEKVRRDMEADYERISQGRDTYFEDPRINKLLPEIVGLYEKALSYADEMEMGEYAQEFAHMLETIKKAWAM